MIHWTDPLRGVTGSMTFADWWNSCFQGDYMVQMLRCVGYPDDRKLRLLACRLVRETRIDSHRTRTVWDLLTDERSRSAVEVAERYAEGEATDEELEAATVAAWSAAQAAASSAEWAAAWAATSAATAAACAAAWAAASAAAWPPTSAATSAARATAMKSALAQQAGIIRDMIPAEEVEPLFERYALRLLLTKNDCKLLNEQCKIDR